MVIFHRLYSGDDGMSHFETRELNLKPGDAGDELDFAALPGMQIRQTPDGWIQGFHPAPRRQFVINLTGSMRIDCGNGEVRTLGPGEILLGDDLTGKGHHSTEMESPRVQVLVYLPDSVDLDAISRVVP